MRDDFDSSNWIHDNRPQSQIIYGSDEDFLAERQSLHDEDSRIDGYYDGPRAELILVATANRDWVFFRVNPWIMAKRSE